ncbi:MAG: hypothetical protein PVS2B1_17140 [Candidatus Dormibacteraceae bacterium]
MSKKPSGAQNRRRARERSQALEAERIANDDDPVTAEFEQLGRPDIDDPVTQLEWARKALGLCAWMAMTFPLTESLRERIKCVRELAFVMGTTHARSLVERRLKKLEKDHGVHRNEGKNDGAAVSATSGSALRTGRKAERRGALSRPVPGDSTEDDG